MEDFRSKEPSEGYLPICQAITAPGYSLHRRIATIEKLILQCCELKNTWKDELRSISPAAVLVNITNGDVRILPEKGTETADVGDYLWLYREGAPLEEEAWNEYIAYSIFRLICTDNPYDGRKALLEYPLITPKAGREWNRRKYPLAILEGENKYSVYSHRGIFAKWRSLPAFLQRELAKELSPDYDPHKKTEDWIILYRKIRDSLVLVDGQFGFCDPDKEQQVSFMEIGEYRIPILHRKAVYRYHLATAGPEKDNNGVIAGVDAEGRLKNYTQETWKVTVGGEDYDIAPGQTLKPEVTMCILAEGTRIRIVSGRRNGQDEI